MSSDFKAALYGWGILIAFIVIRYFYKENKAKKIKTNISTHEIEMTISALKFLKNKKEREKKENDDPQILYFKSNQGAFEFALISLMNGFGSMNSDFLGIITGKPFGKKKEVQKKIKGDVETVTNEITKYKIKIAYRGKEIEAVGHSTDHQSNSKISSYKIGDLVVVIDLSHSLFDKFISRKARDENLDHDFAIMRKVKPVFNITKKAFNR